MAAVHVPTMLLGFVVGGITNEAWRRHCEHELSNAAEAGDFERAERATRKAMIAEPRTWLKPPPDLD